MEAKNTLKKKNLPKPLPLKKLLGPSFILLGLGLGSGEIILWPYLASRYGMGIIWAAVLGITFQFFINMEIERYTLLRGESVFVGLTRKMGKIIPFWFIVSTLIPWMWPGIIASSAKIFSNLLGINYTKAIPIIFLVIIGIIFTLGPVIYKTQEKLLKIVISISIPLILLITTLIAKKEDLPPLFAGLVGKGDNFWFLPQGISIAAFLGAVAYAGAGGNLNLAQSFYVKEKGYGMGKYSGRITSILTGKAERINLEGYSFTLNQKNLERFKNWWKAINIEHFVVFLVTGAFTMIILSFLSYLTVYGQETESGIGFISTEAKNIGLKTAPLIGSIFLGICSLTLFFTQFSVIDATSRIMSENLILLNQNRFKVENLPKFYYFFLWSQITLGVVIFMSGITEPLTLLVLGAVLNAFTMFVYTILILWLNNSLLEKPLRPNILRKLFLISAFVFYGIFSFLTIAQYLNR